MLRIFNVSLVFVLLCVVWSLTIGTHSSQAAFICPGDGGWEWYNPAPQGNGLLAVRFVNGNTGWAVGANGTVLGTTDGGESWRRQPSGTNKGLLCVRFLDDKTGWAVGDGGVIIKTTDGGSTWEKQSSGVTDCLFSIYAADKEHVCAAGNLRVLNSADGGTTWACRDLGTWAAGTVYFTDRNTGWIISGKTMLHTSTAGLPGCVWVKDQPDGTPASFGHLVVTRKSDGYLLAEHPESRAGIHIKTSDTKPNIGDYIYVHGKVTTENAEKVIAADSIDIQCAGWGVLPAKEQ